MEVERLAWSFGLVKTADADMIFRELRLSEGVPGRLYLHSMPGRYEPFAASLEDLRTLEIQQVISLAPPDEMVDEASAYAKAIGNGDVPCDVTAFFMADYNLPKDRVIFRCFVEYVARLLRAGVRLVLHCGAGIGRTGTFACCLLISLGLEMEDACRCVKDVGSSPEIPGQWDLVEWYAAQHAT